MEKTVLPSSASVWFAIPYAGDATEVRRRLALWRQQGYKIALWRGYAKAECLEADFFVDASYPGYAVAVNVLVGAVFALDNSVDWVVTGGDDNLPDMHIGAQVIASQCTEHFSGTLGVMQPTGDTWGGGWACGSSTKTCPSPWLGREFCRIVNRGRGPLWREYTHMFVDEELKCVAEMFGVLWQRNDLTQLHEHFCREDTDGKQSPVPEYLREVHGAEHWHKYQKLFNERKAMGFPGSALL